MRILTYTTVIGTSKCDLRCPYCVSTMTPHYPVTSINQMNLKAGAQLAVRGGATTLLLTGKGEPTLYPDQITEVLTSIGGEFPIIELQTNGLRIARGDLDVDLREWRRLGLKTIAVSVVHWDSQVNNMMRPRVGAMPDLDALVRKIEDFGFTTRLSVVMVKGGIDSRALMAQFIDWAREHHVHQLTFRPVARPEDAFGPVADWIQVNDLSSTNIIDSCHQYLQNTGTTLLKLNFGAEVFDVKGQNVCLTNCLTLDKTGQEVRQLIYCTDGHIRYDWRYEGAILF